MEVLSRLHGLLYPLKGRRLPAILAKADVAKAELTTPSPS
jgi:hypothetical protein